VTRQWTSCFAGPRETDTQLLRRGKREFGIVEREIAVGGQVVTIRGLRGDYDDLFVPFFGEHQASNACAALVAVEAIPRVG
jgi:dihydrofolate synthase/folylpolyglutamate synthase